MKKRSILMSIGLILLLILTGCAKNKPSRNNLKTMTTDSSTAVTQSQSSSTADSSNTTTTTMMETKASHSSSSTESNEPSRNLPDQLLPYTDSQIEYARVWLAVLGSDYVNYLDDPDFNFELNVSLIPKGTLINQYAEDTPTYPVDVITLAGNASFQGSVIYASNYNGTVTVYPTPMHWHYSEEQSKDHDFLTQASQWILDNTEVINVPAGDPDSVKRLIDVMKLNF